MHRICRQWIVDVLQAHLPLVALAVRQRAKFEGWLKFELAAHAERQGAILVAVEAGNEEGSSRADITFSLDGRRYYLELKTPNTNYRMAGVEQKHRPITKNIREIVEDAHKLQLCPGQGVIAFTLFPILPRDTRWHDYLIRIADQLQLTLTEQDYCSRVVVPLNVSERCEIVVCCFEYPLAAQERSESVTTTRYGYPLTAWMKAKEEMRAILITHAQAGQPIPYSDVARQIQTIHFEPDAYAFHTMLGEISTEEDDAGRGMLSVIVVHKDGDQLPGAGFFTLAKQMGRDTTDRVRCWIEETTKVYTYWERHK